MSAQPEPWCHCSPQIMMQLVGWIAGTSKTCGAEPADNASPAKLFVTEGCKANRATTVTGPVDVGMFPASRPLSPNEHRLRAQAPGTSVSASASEAAAAVAPGPFVTAPLAIHNHKAIFGWAANLFLAAATSQTTTAEKSGPARLGDPVPGRGDVEGRRFAAHPQPLLPAAHIPHPTVGPGLLCPAWCGCPAWFAQPQPTPPGPCNSVFIYLLHPPLPARLCLTSIFFSPPFSRSQPPRQLLNRFGIPSLVFSPKHHQAKFPTLD